ncbi:MAG: ABC transporter ATP-binding protein/permease [Clostridia bacterium]|nr:ABC transporter ATP-binding protein/permease [Clostridia bacterium]
MLQLKDIKKDYYVADEVVQALKGVSLTFRDSEFVSILGPSGCGKTTLLNIIGGLDRYTSGDLVINGKSTKQFKDKDWDAYRNHRIGFVFQSYNLIPHLTVLENVELALTLSGVSKNERRKKATRVLERVGLQDKIHVKPNQLSGGQMQRVAIARALVNDPDILLADEPTGALDTTTSVQIMELLKEVAREKLVIMVTHNPDLADEYSTRIVRLLDGEVTVDSNPYNPSKTEQVKETKKEKTSMSFFTALTLSFKNLLTKKARTLLVSFAGSIGIIGIALILSLSNGFQLYIDRVQEDALSNYPVTIYNETQNLAAMMETMTQGGVEYESFPDVDEVRPTPILNNLLATSTVGTVTNDLKSFNEYILAVEDLEEHINGIQYSYDVDVNLFKWYEEVDDGVDVSSYRPVNSLDMMSYVPGGNSMSALSSYFDVFTEMLDNTDLLQLQYDLLAGEWNDMANPNQALLVVSEYNTIPDYVLYNLGLRSNNINYQYYKFLLLNGYFDSILGNIPGFILDPDNQFEFLFTEESPVFPDFSSSHISTLSDEQKEKIMNDLLGVYYDETENDAIPMADLVGLTYEVLPTALMYQNNGGVYTLQDADSDFVQSQLQNNSITLEIVGIVRVKEGNASGSLGSGVSYSPALTQEIISKTDNSPVVLAQKADETVDVTTGLAFENNTLSDNYDAFGVVNVDHPESISIFPKTFEDKDYIVELIAQYNADKEEVEQISYTDTLGIMISSMTVILSAITIVLTAFVSTSLVVSSIMIGVITYISVLERIKEIGVLRSVGASKRDIANVFNAEAIIIGFVAGLLGLCITLLITIPVNIIVKNLTGIVGVATLPWVGGVALGLISILLTFVAGLIPSKMAANKDPVEALRSE